MAFENRATEIRFATERQEGKIRIAFEVRILKIRIS